MMYELTTGTFLPMLDTLSQILDRGADHMRAQGKEPDALMEARLAPDMFPLPFQIEFACYQALSCVDMVTGKKPAEFANSNPKTLGDLKARIEATSEKLKALKPNDFEGADARKIEMPLQAPLHVEANGFEILRNWTLPNFYFHVVTAYDILRHQGVELGKRDYMGTALGPYIRQRA